MLKITRPHESKLKHKKKKKQYGGLDDQGPGVLGETLIIPEKAQPPSHETLRTMLLKAMLSISFKIFTPVRSLKKTSWKQTIKNRQQHFHLVGLFLIIFTRIFSWKTPTILPYE